MRAKEITKQAVIAAVYVVLTIVFSAISFGAVQCRVSSTMHQLVAYKRRYAIGLILGVVVANAFSPLGVIDMVFGVATSVTGYAAAVAIMRLAKSQTAKNIIVGVCVTVSTIFVALELHILYELPILATWATVAAGQAITQIVGVPMFAAMNKVVNFSGEAAKGNQPN